METILPTLENAVLTDINNPPLGPLEIRPDSSDIWRRGGRGLAALTMVVLAACGGGDSDKVYGPADLASAPHDAKVNVPIGTALVFEEEEGPDCKKVAMNSGDRHAAAGPSARPIKSRFSRGVSPSSGPKSSKPKGTPITICEGSELQFEMCQLGANPDTDAETTAPDCAHVDVGADAFRDAIGIYELIPGQKVIVTQPLQGEADRD